MCWAPSGSRCAEGPKGAPMVKGLHAARRTPWRVRIEVRDLAPGPNRIHVCISEEVQKRKKSKPRPPKPATVDGSEDHSARMLVACGTCGAHVGEKCRRIGKGRAVVLHEVHATRALLAGHDVSPLVRSVLAEQAAAVSGFVKGKAPRRIVGPPVVRVAYPWTQPACAGCDGSGRMLVHRPGMPESARFVAACERCKGRGIVGPLFLSIDEAVKATQPDKTYRVPAAHVARWGAQVTLFPRRYRVAALGVVTVFELKDRR